MGERRLLALARGHRMKRLLRRMLDPNEFLQRLRHPLAVASTTRTIPTCSTLNGTDLHASTTSRRSRRTGLFGGNSNWRGPVWFPINFLLIEALQRFHHYYGDDFTVECPDRLRATC